MTMRARKTSASPTCLKLAAVAQLAGVSRQTVEYYMLLGLLTTPRNPATRRRQFDHSHVRRIKLIKQLNDSGYTLREIRETWLKGK